MLKDPTWRRVHNSLSAFGAVMRSSRSTQLSAVGTVVLATAMLFAGAGVVVLYRAYSMAKNSRLDDANVSPLLADVLEESVNRLYGDEFSLGAGEICHLQIDVHMTGGICKVDFQSPNTPNDHFEVHIERNGAIVKQTGNRLATILPGDENVVSLSELIVASVQHVVGNDRRLCEDERRAFDLTVKQRNGTWHVDVVTGNSPGDMFYVTFDREGKIADFGGGM